jgi:hypothetical protein
MWFQPIEWTPAACAVIVYSGLLVLTGLVLLVPLALGKKNGYYKAYYEKNEPLLEAEVGAQAETEKLRVLEMEIGAHLIMWGWTVMAALVAGADAQIICICQIFAMLALISYFFKVDHKLCALGGFIFIVLFSYVGFMPMPTWPSVAWQPAGIWLVFHQVMLLLLGVMFLTGNAEKHYESYPSTKEFMFKGGSVVHEREILLGAALIGTVLAETASFANAAMNFCLIFAPSGIVMGGVHWFGLGDKKNAINVFVLSSIMFCFGLFPRLLE